MIAWSIAAAALAGNIYVNNNPVDPSVLTGTMFQNVSVQVDAQGNVFITAPGYRSPAAAPAPAAQPYPQPPSPQPAAAGGNPAFPQPGAYPQPNAYPQSNAYPQPAAAALYPNGIPRAHWWLISDDKQSTGHTVEVYVNGQQVQVVKSGEPQRIIDIGSLLHPGPNTIDCKAFSTQSNDGTLYLYLGSGQEQGGTVKMDPPQVQFGVGTNTSYMNARSYTLTVQ
jgi:hypothetical protein